MYIPYTRPSITKKEIEYVNDAISTGWGVKCYDYLYKFQDEFAEYIGVKNAMATSSCTGAILLALASAGISRGDEVIVPDTTWIATATPVVHLGAIPVFIDALPDTWCINPDKIEAAITKKTKAIIVAHVYGNLVDMDKVLEIAKKHDLIVIEDAAEALGSEIEGKKVGSMGDFGVYSFHGTKTMTTGEGGMVVTNNDAFYKKMTILNDQGRDPKIRKAFWSEVIGYKFRMSNLQAALGLAQIERVQELVEKKRKIFQQYEKMLLSIEGLSMNPEKKGTKNSYWMPTIMFDKKLNIDRDNLIRFFKDNDADLRPFFFPLTMFPMFEDKPGNTVSYDIYKRGVNLPSFHDITEEEIKYIVDKLKEYLK